MEENTAVNGFPACYNPECPYHHIELSDNLQNDFVVVSGVVTIRRHLYKYRSKDTIFYCDRCHGAIQHSVACGKQP